MTSKQTKEHRRELTARRIPTLQSELRTIEYKLTNPSIDVQLTDIMHLISTLSELRSCNEIMEELQ